MIQQCSTLEEFQSVLEHWLNHPDAMLCYNGSGPARPGKLSDDEWVDLVQQAIDLGILEAIVSGGEPLMRGQPFVLRLLDRRIRRVLRGKVVNATGAVWPAAGRAGRQRLADAARVASRRRNSSPSRGRGAA